MITMCCPLACALWIPCLGYPQVHLDEITVIVGALGSITLTLILPPLLHNAVRKPGRLRRVGHWAMSAVWTVILVSGRAAALIADKHDRGFRGNDSYRPAGIWNSGSLGSGLTKRVGERLLHMLC